MTRSTRAADGRFLPGCAGRPKGARNKVAPELVRAFADRYGRNAADVLDFLALHAAPLAMFVAQRQVATEAQTRAKRRARAAARREQERRIYRAATAPRAPLNTDETAEIGGDYR